MRCSHLERTTPRQSRRLVIGLGVATVAMLLAVGAVIMFGLRSDDSTERVATEAPTRQQPDEPAAPPPTDPSPESDRESPSAAPTTAPAAPSEPRDECARSMGIGDIVGSLWDLDFSGLSVNVGSKDFVEQLVLGHLLIVGLEAGRADVVDNVNLGGTIVNRDALEANEIDAYWEYTGVGGTVHLGRDDPSVDAQELAIGVCVRDLEENGIRWLGTSLFNNTFGFATAGDMEPTGLDLRGMAQYVLGHPDATVCMQTEYPNRPDGFVLFEDAYSWTMPDEQVNVSLTMPDRVYQQAPDQFRALAHTIVSGLHNATMVEPNRQVAVDGLDPHVVARNHLERLGFI